jgi:hypothetical protein
MLHDLVTSACWACGGLLHVHTGDASAEGLDDREKHKVQLGQKGLDPRRHPDGHDWELPRKSEYSLDGWSCKLAAGAQAFRRLLVVIERDACAPRLELLE